MSTAPTETASASTLNTLQSNVCGYEVIPDSYRTLDKQHYEDEECVICMTEECVRKYACSTCGNRHCVSCHLRMYKCPFCRATFPTHRSLSYFWDILVPRLYWLRNQARLNQTHTPEFRRVFTTVENAYPAHDAYFRQHLHLLHCYEAICHMVYY